MIALRGLVVCLAILAGARLCAAEERVDLFDLVTAAPLPSGYEAKRRDFLTPDNLGNTLILISKPDGKSRVQVTIENKKLKTKEAKIAAYKAAVNGIHGTFTKRGYGAIESSMPDAATLDPDKRLDLRLTMKKPGTGLLYIDAEIFFTDHAFTVWSVAATEAERDTLTEWIGTVRAK